MLQKVLALAFVFLSIGCFVSCGTTGSHYVYAAIPATSQLAVFREDPYSGVLTQLQPSPYTVGSGAQAVVVHPSNKFLYVANAAQSENDISLFDINSDGTVSEVTPRTPAGTSPSFMAIDQSGSFLYVANVGSNTVSAFAIDSGSGALSAVTGSPFAINLTPQNMKLSPSGNFIFFTAAGEPTGLIATFSITSGVISSSPVALASTRDTVPAGLVIDPTGTYLYVANSTVTANSISIFTIDSSGALTEAQGSPLADTSKGPVNLLLDPAGAFLYVANQGSGNIGTYAITSGTGFPVAVTDSPFASETQPSFLAIDPNGKYLYVGNQSAGAGVQAFGIASGSLNAIATYSVGNSPTSIAVVE
jgi:6-phosphogluconolactonase (cycloisomerase 2 family)